MNEYHIDMTCTSDVEQYIIDQGAVVINARNGRTPPVLMFSGRRVHFYAGSDQIRIFFNDATLGAALFLLLKWPKLIFCNTIPAKAMA